MEMLSVENLGFKYDSEENYIFENVSFSLKKGELCLLCGLSGCGKTTLLRIIKKILSPAGIQTGKINLSIDDEKIGYVFQNPESQIVMDNVYDELTFGCANIGMSTELINMRLCEISAFLGIEALLQKKCTSLSGGEKQLINLASILMMEPELILFDEPLSQLDPIAASSFMNILKRIHAELGITIIICEHCIDDILCICDKILYMKNRNIKTYTNRDLFTADMFNEDGFMYNLPEITRFSNDICVGQDTIYSVKEFLYKIHPNNNVMDKFMKWEEKNTNSYFYVSADDNKKNMAIKAKNIYFRYEKNTPDVIENLNMEIKKGEIFSMIGNNGAGKSTLISLLTGFRKPYRGKIISNGSVAYLPQIIDFTFIYDNYLEDLKLLCKNNNIDYKEIDSLMDKYKIFSGMSQYFDKNPLDLSGGEKQLAGIFKILLLHPDILILDEPTKGLDGTMKNRLISLLKELSADGLTIFIVSHDLPFLYRVSNRCAMLFNGKLVAEGNVRTLFKNNRFYTTQVHRAVFNLNGK